MSRETRILDAAGDLLLAFGYRKVTVERPLRLRDGAGEVAARLGQRGAVDRDRGR